YNTSVDKFEAAFEKTGATKGSDSIKINLEPDEDDIKKLDQFTADLIEKAQQ
ncbi:flavodoxin, partial [Lactobacillus parabuchneri]|nr:flavodoxin [Lentilactobacillus parabuchneri]